MVSNYTGSCDLRIAAGISVLAIFFLAGAAWAQPHEEWNRTFTGNALASSVTQAQDGGYIIAGNIDSYEGAGFLIKTDVKGNEQWNKIFKGEKERHSGDWGKNQVSSVKQTSDNGYILAGSVLEGHTIMYESERPDYGVWLIKTDANGNELWNKTFGGKGEEGAYSVQKANDGGYIIAGYTESYGSGDDDAWLIKTDANGNEQWNKTFGGIGFDQIYSGEQTLDSGYILAGVTKSYGGNRAWLIKTDEKGNEQWNQVFGKGSGDAYSAQQTIDGGYILTGSKEVSDLAMSAWPAWLIKTDEKGIEEWNRTFSNRSDARYVRQTKDTGYIIAGRILGNEFGDFNALLLKTDAFGNEEWNMTFGGKADDFASSVAQTSDGGYVIAGTTNSHDYGIGDAWLIKVSGEPDRIDNKTLADDPVLTARTEKVTGFGATLAITILLAVYIIGRKRQ